MRVFSKNRHAERPLRRRALACTSLRAGRDAASATSIIWPAIATGAAQLSRRAVGTPVLFGMLAASSIGIFLIPMLYAVFQGIREGVKRRFGGRRSGH